ncbi:hypothetical protein FQR65_LT14361 [Abscondita terminalis]|nr:hypothetical protein FQR65_LT14361 [Abscondita terminalis]
MFVYVRFKEDGVKLIVTPDKIKHFDVENINYNKAYKVQYTDGEYYRAHIICIGETENEVLESSQNKRFRIPATRFDDSTADDTGPELDTCSRSVIKQSQKTAYVENYSSILENISKNTLPKKSATLIPNNTENNLLQLKISNLKKENNQLKAENEQLANLNKELQEIVITKFKALLENGKKSEQQNIEYAIGTRMNGNVHLGRNIWLPIQIYDSAASKTKRNNYSLLIKELAYAVFGEHTLMNSSVSGVMCNRTKAAPKPALDGTKLMAIKDIVKHTLENNAEPQERIHSVLNSVNHKIAEKIQDLIKPKKKETDDGNTIAIDILDDVVERVENDG